MTTVSSRRVWHKKECSRCIYNGCIDSCIIMIISCFESSQYQGSSALWRGPFAKPGHSHNFQRIQQIERIQSTIRKSRHWSGAIANGHNALWRTFIANIVVARFGPIASWLWILHIAIPLIAKIWTIMRPRIRCRPEPAQADDHPQCHGIVKCGNTSRRFRLTQSSQTDSVWSKLARGNPNGFGAIHSDVVSPTWLGTINAHWNWVRCYTQHRKGCVLYRFFKKKRFLYIWNKSTHFIGICQAISHFR